MQEKNFRVKIHISVDVLVFPYAMLATTANITDRTGAVYMFVQPTFLPSPTLKTVLCDGAYTGEDFAAKIKYLTDAEVQAAKRSELHTFAVIPQRCIVSRASSTGELSLG